MEAFIEEYSLLDELQLRNHYEIVAEKNGQLVYAHTVYYQLEDSDYEDFITEDDEPMDNLFSEKEQRQLVDTLQSSHIDWTNRDFMACANVAIYYKPKKYIVPDMFLSMDVNHPQSWRENKHKCYYLWQMKKLPELALEIVSNEVGNEDTDKKKIYAELGIKYYVIHDPYQYLSDKELRVYELKANQKYVLVRRKQHWMPEINLGIQLWQGLFEREESLWARWCHKDGEVVLTGKERADEEAKLKALAEEKAQEEKERADEEAKLKTLAEEKVQEEKERADKEKAEKEKEKERADKAEEELRLLKAQLEALQVKQE